MNKTIFEKWLDSGQHGRYADWLENELAKCRNCKNFIPQHGYHVGDQLEMADDDCRVPEKRENGMTDARKCEYFVYGEAYKDDSDTDAFTNFWVYEENNGFF